MSPHAQASLQPEYGPRSMSQRAALMGVIPPSETDRLAGEELEVFLQFHQRLGRRHGAVPGDDHCRVQPEDAVTRRDPVGHRSGPHDGVATVEEDVPGEDDTVVW